MSGRTAPTRRPRAEPCRVCAEHCAAACWVRWPAPLLLSLSAVVLADASAERAEQAAAGPRAAPRAPPERAERHRHGRGADLPLRAVTRSSPNSLGDHSVDLQSQSPKTCILKVTKKSKEKANAHETYINKK